MTVTINSSALSIVPQTKPKRKKTIILKNPLQNLRTRNKSASVSAVETRKY
eukprot:Pgem_evm1s3406